MHKTTDERELLEATNLGAYSFFSSSDGKL